MDNYALADKIALELLGLLVDEYKEDQTYHVSTEPTKVDEDDFKEKFPYTLDRPTISPS